MSVRETCKTIFSPQYDRIISDLVDIRQSKSLTQRAFAAKSGYKHSFVAKTELRDRRMDFIEIVVYLKNLGLTTKQIKAKLTEWADLFVE